MRRTAFHSVVALALLLATPVGAQAPGADRAADKARVERMFREYVAAFSAGDAKETATYYNEPLMLLGVGKVMASPTELEGWVAGLLVDLQSRGITRLPLSGWP